MLLSCYNSNERVEQFSLYEVCEGEEYQRKLHQDDSPLKVTQRWTSPDRHLRIRRNPDYNPHRRMVRLFFFNDGCGGGGGRRGQRELGPFFFFGVTDFYFCAMGGFILTFGRIGKLNAGVLFSF